MGFTPTYFLAYQIPHPISQIPNFFILCDLCVLGGKAPVSLPYLRFADAL